MVMLDNPLQLHSQSSTAAHRGAPGAGVLAGVASQQQVLLRLAELEERIKAAEGAAMARGGARLTGAAETGQLGGGAVPLTEALWVKKRDAADVWYVNTLTGESSWTLPEGAKVVRRAASASAQALE